jgi:SUMO ligase MMS21 Smc5/6 complex component
LGYTELIRDKVPENTKEFKMLQSFERHRNNCKNNVENLMCFAQDSGTTFTITLPVISSEEGKNA